MISKTQYHVLPEYFTEIFTQKFEVCVMPILNIATQVSLMPEPLRNVNVYTERSPVLEFRRRGGRHVVVTCS